MLKKFLQTNLQPQGTAKIVRIGFTGSTGAAYYNGDFILQVIDELDKRLMSHHLDPITPLERIGIDAVLSSVYVNTPQKLRDVLASFEKWNLENGI